MITSNQFKGIQTILKAIGIGGAVISPPVGTIGAIAELFDLVGYDTSLNDEITRCIEKSIKNAVKDLGYNKNKLDMLSDFSARLDYNLLNKEDTNLTDNIVQCIKLSIKEFDQYFTYSELKILLERFKAQFYINLSSNDKTSHFISLKSLNFIIEEISKLTKINDSNTDLMSDILNELKDIKQKIFKHSINVDNLNYSYFDKLTNEITILKSRISGIADIELKNEFVIKLKNEYVIELKEKEAELDRIKDEVISLGELFNKIPVDTERLKRAQEHFEKGEIIKSDEILNPDEIMSEAESLKKRKEKLARENEEIDKNLNNNANEFLIKAKLWTIRYDEPAWFEKANKYYETALSISRNVDIIFEYALFLQNHNKHNDSEPLYSEALAIRRKLAQDNPMTYLPDVAMTLNNLANLQSDKNEYDIAEQNYSEALAIRRKLAQDNPMTYLPYVAVTLNNLAILFINIENKVLSIKYANETISILTVIKFKTPKMESLLIQAKEIIDYWK